MNNEKEVRELLQLQKKIEDAKGEKARLEGELKALVKRLMEEFGSDNPKEVERKIEGMKQQAERLRRQIQDGLVVLRKEVGG